MKKSKTVKKKTTKRIPDAAPFLVMVLAYKSKAWQTFGFDSHSDAKNFMIEALEHGCRAHLFAELGV